MNWWRWIVWGPIILGFGMAVCAAVYAVFATFFGKD